MLEGKFEFHFDKCIPLCWTYLQLYLCKVLALYSIIHGCEDSESVYYIYPVPFCIHVNMIEKVWMGVNYIKKVVHVHMPFEMCYQRKIQNINTPRNICCCFYMCVCVHVIWESRTTTSWTNTTHKHRQNGQMRQDFYNYSKTTFCLEWCI